MPEYQTSIQDLTAILRGSGKLEISPYQASPSWLDCGSLSGLEVEEKLEVNKEENDNADADELVTSQEVGIKANLHESLKAAVWDVIRSGFDTKSIVAGAEVAGAVYDFEADSTDDEGIFILPGQNANGNKQTISSISQDPEGTPVALTVGDDWVQVKDSAGRWGLKFIAGAGYDPTELIRVTYTYTPPASIKYVSGDKVELPWFMVRITTKNDGSTFYFTGYKAKIRAGKKFTYPKDDDNDRRVKAPIEIVCKTDPLYHSDLVYETVQTGGM